MPDIKIGTTSIINLERGSTDINFVYRGTTLVWSRTAPTNLGYVDNGFEFNTDKQLQTNTYSINGLNFILK